MGLIKLSNRINENFYEFFYNRNITIEKIFVVVAFVLGMIYSFAVIPGQVPDEPTHMDEIRRSYGYTVGSYNASEIYRDYFSVTWNNLTDPTVQSNGVLTPYVKDFKLSSEARSMNKPWKFTAIRYVPAAIGYNIGVALNLPLYYILQLAEFFSVLFYVLMGYFTLKLLPFMKELMFAVLLLPVNIQQCASINYDSVLLPVCALLIAYIFNCAYVKKSVGWKETGFIAVLSLLVLLIKPPYVLLAMLFFIIPKDKVKWTIGKSFNLYRIIVKYWYLWSVLAIGTFVGALFMLRTNPHGLAGLAFLKHPKLALVVYKQDFVVRRPIRMWGMIGDLGWLNNPINKYLYRGSILLGLMLVMINGRNESKGRLITIKNRLWFFFVASLVACMIKFALITWGFRINNQEISTVEEAADAIYENMIFHGCQGRYFIPIVFLVFAIIYDVIRIDKRKIALFITTAFTCWIGYGLYFLFDRFWF